MFTSVCGFASLNGIIKEDRIINASTLTSVIHLKTDKNEMSDSFLRPFVKRGHNEAVFSLKC